MSQIRKCPNCGAPFDDKWKKLPNGEYKCLHCGTHHDMDGTSATSSEFNRIYRMLENINFTSADAELRDLRQKYPNNSKVYFLSALSNNCICYTENDNGAGVWPYEKIPTLNNVRFENILETEYVKKAISLAENEDERKYYTDVFEYVEKVRKKIETAYKAGENQYDVFISVKVNKVDETTKQTIYSEDGEPVKTTDYNLANGLYDYIHKMIPGCKVFLSERLQDQFIGKEYEHIIFSALQSAKVFILVSNSLFNTEWHWVRNEWMRYLYLMNAENDGKADKRSFVFVTKNMNLNDLPAEFKKRQAIQWGKVGAETDLINFVRQGVFEKEKVTKIQAKTFDTEVSSIQMGKLEEMSFATRKLNNSDGNISLDTKYEIESFIDDLEKAQKKIADKDPRGQALRKDAFDGLRRIANSNDEAYKAKLYLLLENTKFTTLNEYFSDLRNLIDSSDFSNKYFEFAAKEDAKKAIEKVCDLALKEKLSIYLNVAFRLIISPYIEEIDKTTLVKLHKHMKDVYFGGEKDVPELILGDNILLLARYFDGNNPEKYISNRKELIDNIFSGERISKDSIEWANKYIDEILQVNKGDVEALWIKLMINSSLECPIEPGILTEVLLRVNK